MDIAKSWNKNNVEACKHNVQIKSKTNEENEVWLGRKMFSWITM